MSKPLIYKREATYQGHTALKFQMEMGKYMGTSRFVINGDRLYLLTALINKAEQSGGDAEIYS